MWSKAWDIQFDYTIQRVLRLNMNSMLLSIALHIASITSNICIALTNLNKLHDLYYFGRTKRRTSKRPWRHQITALRCDKLYTEQWTVPRVYSLEYSSALYTYIVYVVYIEREKNEQKYSDVFTTCTVNTTQKLTKPIFNLSACGLRNHIRVCRKRKPKLPLEFRNGMFCFVRNAGHRSLTLSYPIIAAKFRSFHQWITEKIAFEPINCLRTNV